MADAAAVISAVSAKMAMPSLSSPSTVLPTYDPSKFTKEEANDIFWSLLRDNSIHKNMTWDECIRLVINDPRYGVFETVSLRKKSFFLYCEHLAKEEKERVLHKEKALRERFCQVTLQEIDRQLLEQHVSDRMGAFRKLRYEQFEDFIKTNPETSVIELDSERHLLFEELLFQEESNERNRLEKLRARQRELLLALYRSDQSINIESQWRKVKDHFDRQSKQLQSDPGQFSDEDQKLLVVWSESDPIDRLEVFEQLMRDLESQYFEQRRLRRLEEAKRGRMAREAFRVR